MKVLVIDNYDSFTFNLVHYLDALGAEVTVWRNDAFELRDVEPFNKILLSPGPGIPDEAGLLKPLIHRFAKTKCILGVCLGQQAIAEVFGGTLTNLPRVFHGISSEITIIEDDKLFDNVPKRIQVGRYHSWVAASPLPDTLIPTSYDELQNVMSLRHRQYNLRGVQFHPESVLTPHGKQILQNWLML